jgi:hypothetical protein
VIQRVMQVMGIALIVLGVAIGYGAMRPYISHWLGREAASR